MKRIIPLALSLVAVSGIEIAILTPHSPCRAGSCGECTTSAGTRGILTYDYRTRDNRCRQCDGRVGG